MKKFTKQFLKEVLQFDEESIKLTMEVQRKFPEVLVNEGEFIDSVRHLYLELGLDKSHWSRWIRKNIIGNEFFIENVDWIGFTIMANGNEVQDFKVSLEFAKHLSMMQRTENSHKVRSYFILMEKAIKGIKEHELIREPEKKGYNELCKCIEDYAKINYPNSDIEGMKKREANMLNICLVGMTSSDIRLKLKYNDIETREHLEIKHNKALYELQLLDCGLLSANLDFNTRKKIIQDNCNKKFKDYYIK